MDSHRSSLASTGEFPGKQLSGPREQKISPGELPTNSLPGFQKLWNEKDLDKQKVAYEIHDNHRYKRVQKFVQKHKHQTFVFAPLSQGWIYGREPGHLRA